MVGRIRIVTYISLLVCILSGCSKPASESGAAKPNDPSPAPICSHDEIEYNEIISQEVSSNSASETFDFEVIYKNAPQFLITDCHKRQAHAFQFYIAYDTNEIPVSDESWDVIIRGGEIHLDGKIRLRDANRMGPHDGEESGGWGPLMTSTGIDYQITGKTLHFSIPWEIIGDSDGSIYYDLLNTNYGGMNLLIKNTLVE